MNVSHICKCYTLEAISIDVSHVRLSSVELIKFKGGLCTISPQIVGSVRPEASVGRFMAHPQDPGTRGNIHYGGSHGELHNNCIGALK